MPRKQGLFLIVLVVGVCSTCDSNAQQVTVGSTAPRAEARGSLNTLASALDFSTLAATDCCSSSPAAVSGAGRHSGDSIQQTPARLESEAAPA